jgi:ComF family protein
MNSLLTTFIDSLFPPSDEALLVRNLRSEEVSNLVRVTPIPHGYAFTRYTDKHIRALIHEAKFQRNKGAFTLLNALFRIGLQALDLKADLIVPVPLSSHRLRARGYNQVYEILSAGDAPPDIPIVADALIRVRDTRPQTELSRTERLSNLSGAFRVTRPEHIKGKNIFLVDDVMTTGATMAMARDVLMEASPASVTCMTLAH